jgi:hypothetical protein
MRASSEYVKAWLSILMFREGSVLYEEGLEMVCTLQHAHRFTNSERQNMQEVAELIWGQRV